MTDLIHRLLDESIVINRVPYLNSDGHETGVFDTEQIIDTRKFAALIIQECVDSIDDVCCNVRDHRGIDMIDEINK